MMNAGSLTKSALGLVAALTIVAAAHDPASAADYRMAAAANGGTLTNPVLQRDVTTQLRAAAGAFDSCPTVSIPRKTVVRFTNPRTPWIERWTMADCGHVRSVTILFKISPAGGTDFAVSLKR